MSRPPRAILFACNYNHVRSPMAAALMRQMFGQDVFVESCGLQPRPAEEGDPLVTVVMDEVGLNLARHAPKTFDDLTGEAFDLIVSLTPEAHRRALELSGAAGVEAEYWPTADPTLGEMRSRDAALDAYRAVRDDLRARLRARFGAPSTPDG